MKKTLLRVTAVLLSALLLTLSLASCANRGRTLMTLEKDGVKVTLSANVYELMLSRGKGSLVANKSTINGAYATQDSFWSYTSKFGGDKVMTYDEYYRSLVLDNCKAYLAAMYLYEKNGLSLDAKSVEEVETLMSDLLKENGEGSKSKLNAVLSAYGVNYNILKDVYLMQEKLEQLQVHLYGENASNVGTDVKDDYLKEHYLHFQQIFLPNTNFVYETDAFGDVIYYYTSGEYKDHIYYDTGNGVPGTNPDGTPMKDKYGDVIYFINNGRQDKIAYNFSNGSPVKVMDGSSYKVEKMDAEELELLRTRADSIYQSLKGNSREQFEEKYELILDEYTVKDEAYGNMSYEDGYYIRKDLDYLAAGSAYSYLDTIVKSFATMEDGDVILVESESGYHIIMKYAVESGAYSNEVNTQWFSGFNDALVEKLFLELCKNYYADIRIDEKVLAAAPIMKDVGANIVGY